MFLKLAKARPALGALVTVLTGSALMVSAVPLAAQSAPSPEAEARLRKLEAEVRALQRQVFPGSDGKFFTPQVTAPAVPAGAAPGVPATTPVTDLLTRMDAVEAQISRLTAQSEETANRVAQIEAKLGLGAAAPVAPTDGAAVPALPAPATTIPAATTTTPAAIAPSAAAVPAPVTAAAPTAAAQVTPAAVVKPVVAATQPAVQPAGPSAAKPTATKPATKPATVTPPAKPSAQRIAAVAKIAKPDTGNAGDDEYSYGFRLWEAKFFPEAQQQLRLYVDKYPRDPKISFGRNLLGRAFLDDGKPRDAAPWFLKNYQSDKKGARAAESLLLLAESMRQLNDVSRACIALAEFADTYPGDVSGRLKGQYDSTRTAVKCD